MSAWVALPIIPVPIIPPPVVDLRTSRSQSPPTTPSASRAPAAANRPIAARRVILVIVAATTRLSGGQLRLDGTAEPDWIRSQRRVISWQPDMNSALLLLTDTS